MDITGTITISCRRGEEDYMSITLVDGASRISFLDIKMTLEEFAKAVTGQGFIPFNGTARNFGNLGKQKITEDFEFKMPSNDFINRKESAAVEAKRVCPEGWLIDTYFGSQSSFVEKGGDCWASTSIYKFVEVSDN